MATPYYSKAEALAAFGAELRDRTGLGADKTSRGGLNDKIDKALEAISLLSQGFIKGLTLSNNATDATNDIDIAAGVCVGETSALEWMRLASTMTKRIDASWAAGSGNGGLFSGTVANSTWYHVFLIQKTADQTIDAGFDTSLTAANIPTGYAAYRRLGSVYRNASSSLAAFVQTGDEFWWKVPIADYSASNPGTSAVTPTLTVPPSTLAIVDATVRDITPTGSSTHCLVTSPSQTDTAPTSALFSMSIPAGISFTERIESARMKVRTSSSRQIRLRVDNSDADVSLQIVTQGWFDRRGKD